MGGQVCSNGTCSAACGSGLARCGTACVNLQNDKNNCGFCAQACNGALICTNGDCACPTGTTDCSGVCADLSSSAADCGSCGTSCAAGQTCVSSHCQ
jgi:hypothetical protein